MTHAPATFAARARERLAGAQILLFGSRARCDHLLTSDADVLVVSPTFAGVREDDRMAWMLELWEGPVRLQPLCFTPEEFEERRRAISMVAVAARDARPLA